MITRIPDTLLAKLTCGLLKVGVDAGVGWHKEAGDPVQHSSVMKLISDSASGGGRGRRGL